MPIKPIDLQTLFAQLNQVGRQQAAEKDGANLHATLHNNLVTRMEDEASKAVHRPKEDQSATKSINTKSQSGNSPSGTNTREKNKEEEPETPTEVISDPNLGSHIDISG